MAVVVGAFAALTGAGVLLSAPAIDSDSPEEKLFLINAVVGTGILFLGIGVFLVVQAASALGNTASTPFRAPYSWVLLAAFPPLVVLGQWMANHPERTPWLFPFVNIAMISLPSVGIAAIAAMRYARAQELAWPVSWREWTSGLAYGAVGATTVAALINSAYLLGVGALFVVEFGHGPVFPFDRSLRTLPHGWGVFFDVSVLSVAAPLNEEFWKGLLVALFFFRRGGPARCFLWGVLAGTGFNLLETFQNSLGAVSPRALADETIGSAWWFFASARAGTAAMHGLASGMAALAFYGVLHRKWRYAVGYPAAVLLHGTWNFLVYAVWGDAMLSRAWTDSRAVDVSGGAGLALVFAGSLAMLWLVSGRLRDDGPGPPYSLLGMAPAAAGNRYRAYAGLSKIGASSPAGTLTRSAAGSTQNSIGESPI